MPYDPQVGLYTKVWLPSRERRIRRRPLKRNLFVRGPIPIALLARCVRLHPAALAVMLRLKADADTLGVPVTAGSALARSLGLHPRAMKRALAALERDGLIEVERGRGRAPRVGFDSRLFDMPSASRS
jgi:hypothetical protein